MKYENIPHKIKNIWENSESVKDKISKENNKIIIIKNNIIPFDLLNFKKIRNFSTEWEDLEEVEYEMYYKQWKITFEKFLIRYIPFISQNILFETTAPDYPIITDYKYIQHIYKIEDIVGEDNLKKVTLITNIAMDTDNPIKAKLVISIYNPENLT